MTKKINTSIEWYMSMRISEDYLRIHQMQPYMTYIIWARNADVGVWLPEKYGFLISRYKINPEPFLFVEYHWDNGEPYGTVKPIQALELCTFFIPDPSDYRDERHNKELCGWLDGLTAKHTSN